jgi:hypothetical protein
MSTKHQTSAATVSKGIATRTLSRSTGRQRQHTREIQRCNVRERNRMETDAERVL